MQWNITKCTKHVNFGTVFLEKKKKKKKKKNANSVHILVIVHTSTN